MLPLAEALRQAVEHVRPCTLCGNLDGHDPCHVCRDTQRDQSLMCVVEDVADLWAMERSHAYRGQYHVLGGTLSALDGVRPADLKIDRLLQRIKDGDVREVILALNATIEGQTTAHYVADKLAGSGIAVSRLAHGLPMGGELDYLDDGTLTAALQARRKSA